MSSDGFIFTYTGQRFWPMAPRTEDVDVRDIAHALANTCRWGGHVKRFYSVAEHSVWVSKHVPAGDALWGLFHDAAEAYMPDVPTPIKRAIPELGAMEERLLSAIAPVVGLELPIPPSVREADARMLVTEAQALLPEGLWQELLHFGESYTYSERLMGLCPDEAEALFMDRLAVLRAGPRVTLKWKDAENADKV